MLKHFCKRVQKHFVFLFHCQQRTQFDCWKSLLEIRKIHGCSECSLLAANSLKLEEEPVKEIEEEPAKELEKEPVKELDKNL